MNDKTYIWWVWRPICWAFGHRWLPTHRGSWSYCRCSRPLTVEKEATDE